MCVIVYKPIGRTVSDDLLKECWKRNHDGIGFMFPGKSKVIVIKDKENIDKIIAKYRKMIPKEKEIPVIWHLRRATVGEVSAKNTQPFEEKNYAYCHNGTIESVKKIVEENESDSSALGRLYLNHMNVFQESVKNIVERSIGWSRIALMNKHGNVAIINEAGGTWRDGIWFSNLKWENWTEEQENATREHSINCVCQACLNEAQLKISKYFHRPTKAKSQRNKNKIGIYRQPYSIATPIKDGLLPIAVIKKLTTCLNCIGPKLDGDVMFCNWCKAINPFTQRRI
jgi:hypothetical protein